MGRAAACTEEGEAKGVKSEGWAIWKQWLKQYTTLGMVSTEVNHCSNNLPLSRET